MFNSANGARCPCAKSLLVFLIASWTLIAGSLLCQCRSAKAQVLPPFTPATTVQLPVFGVAVSPEGVLEQRQFAPAGGEIFLQRAAAARAFLNADIQKPSPIRKISLSRLQKAIAARLDKGESLPDEILKLAGLQRIEYVFAMPDSNDILLAGPAEGWIEDADGRAVGMSNRRPVILLEDLLVALRTFRAEQPKDIWVGCSIGSTAEGLRRLKEFQRTIPVRVRRDQEEAVALAVWEGVENALGDAGVSVFGISPATNMALVMIEADYRMKLIGIGREPPPIEMPVFFERLKGAPRDNFQRWWFTPDYQCIEMTDDHLSLRIAGQGVKLGTEEYQTDRDGRLIELRSNPLPAARRYAESFTEKYSQIAAASPVFGQLRNMVDVLVVANFIQREGLFARTGLNPAVLLDSDRIPVENRIPPVRARSLANVKWESGTLVAPSGGVSILASQAFRDDLRIPVSNEFRSTLESIPDPSGPDRWWWD